MKQYVELVKRILNHGVVKKDRTGVGTISVSGHTMKFNLQEGFPLLWLKRTHFKALAYEMLWFIGVHRNQYPYSYLDMTNIKYLVDHGVNIWNDWPYEKFYTHYTRLGFTDMIPARGIKEDEYESVKDDLITWEGNDENCILIPDHKMFANKIKNSLHFAAKWGNLGPVYGKQWRNWEVSKLPKGRLDEIIEILYSISVGEASQEAAGSLMDQIIEDKKQATNIDQLQTVIETLKTNPWDRGIKISSWNVAELKDMALRPCHYDMQFLVTPDTPNHKLTLILGIRSNDIGLGNPFNVAQYALLLTMISHLVDMVPFELIVNIGDAHIYSNHIHGMKEVLRRWETYEHFELPKLSITRKVENIDDFRFEDFKLENYKFHPFIKLPVAV